MKKDKRVSGRNIWRFIICFFAIIIFFTILSRVIYNERIAVVTVSTPKQGVVEHTVSASGTVFVKEESALVIEEGLLIERIYVSANEKVMAGQPLVKIDGDSLESMINQCRGEIRKLQLQNQDINAQEKFEEENAKKTYQKAVDEYDAVIQEQEMLVNAAAESLESAKAAYNVFVEQHQAAEAEYREQLSLLETRISEAQSEYDNAIKGRESSIAAATSNLKYSEASTLSTTQIEQNTITMAQYQEKLDKLELLKETEGILSAEEDSYVTEIKQQVGEMTTGTAVLLLADLSQGMRLTGEFAKEDAQYLSVGAAVQVETEYQLENEALLEELTVKSISQTVGGAGNIQVTVDIPQDALFLGAAVEMKVTVKSQPYESCIDKTALHQDGKNQYFVYVAEEENTILGTETVANKVEVQLLDANSSIAAVDGIYAGQEIILQSTRELTHKSTVKLQEAQ